MLLYLDLAKFIFVTQYPSRFFAKKIDPKKDSTFRVLRDSDLGTLLSQVKTENTKKVLNMKGNLKYG